MRGIDSTRLEVARRLSLGLWCVLIFVLASGGTCWSAERASEGPAQPLVYSPSPNIPLSKGAFLGYESAIRIGLERHPLLRRSKETALAAEAVTDQAASRYYPELNAYAIQTGGTVRPLSAFNVAGAQNKPTSYIESAGFRADQLIYDFGQTVHKVLAERAGQEAAEKDILTHKATVILTVQQAYIHCLRQKRLVEIAEETVRERGVLRDQIAILYKRELKSKLDFDFISVELKNAEIQLVQAKNELRAAFAGLNNAMGVRGAEDYTLEDLPAAASSLSTLETLITQALEDRPELLGTADRIKQADERLSSAQALNFPTIAAQGMSGVIHFSDAPLNQYAGSHPGQTNLWWGAGAMVSVPIFTGFLIENRVGEARQQKYKAEQRKIDLSNRIALEVADAYLTLQTARQQITVEEKEVESARSALTLAKERYRLGLASIVDVTTATTALLASEVRLSEARYAVQVGIAAVAFATGTGYQRF
ncbi:MAG: TolC family protein [Nitrospirae bacterium]|nr:TolC family protein [Nitrospirota bacterium]MDE3221307.1 TolC family protein [Nitrospirota bacterium]